MFKKLLDVFQILDRLAVTKKPCTIVADLDILEEIKKRQTSEGARLIQTSEIMQGKNFTPQPGPYFVVTANSEHDIKRRLRQILSDSGLYPEIYGALHDLSPNVTAEHTGGIGKCGMESAYEIFRSQPAFAITCTPRSGSQHIAREMRNHLLGHPLEHIRPPLIEFMASRFDGQTRFGGFDFTHWFASLMHYGTENGVFGTKLISHFLRDFDVNATRMERAAFDEFLSRIPIIYLLRENKLMQALSRDRAKVTRNYHLFDENKREHYQERSQAWDYDFKRISQEIRALHKEEVYLHSRILQTVSPQRMMLARYEELNIPKIVCFVEKQLKITSEERKKQLETNVLRDDLTRSYAEAFSKDYSAAYKSGDSSTHLPHRVELNPENFEIGTVTDPDCAAFQ